MTEALTEALGQGQAYQLQLRELAGSSADVDTAVRAITADGVRRACDLLAAVYEASDGVNGRVSYEVDPRLAHDTDATITEAKTLWTLVDRPHLFITIPATVEDLPAISAVLAEGISGNVTVIFSLQRYASMFRHARTVIVTSSCRSCARWLVFGSLVEPGLPMLQVLVVGSWTGVREQPEHGVGCARG